MTQVNKFYLASFLKNQVYFVPIMVLFFQDLGLTYAQIFWIFTIGSAFSFLIEIPTGMFADLYGNRKSIIISKFLIFSSFILFGIADNFVFLLIANLIYELGKSFRSGTETAYVFNYLDDGDNRNNNPSYSRIKINQKFYARISESLAALIGGFVAYRFGFSFVFCLAALPALINFLQSLSWEKLSFENNGHLKSFSLADNFSFIRSAFFDVFKNKLILKIIINISLFSAAFAALDKFIQPYMKEAGVELQYFGIIYAVFLIFVAFLTKFAAKLEDKLGGERIMNYSSFFALLPLLFLAFGAKSIFSVALFFIVLMIDNLRSPVVNTLFHEQIGREKRATMGSILELVKSLNKLWILPLIGYMADIYSIKTAILVIAIIVLINGILFGALRIGKKNLSSLETSL